MITTRFKMLISRLNYSIKELDKSSIKFYNKQKEASFMFELFHYIYEKIVPRNEPDSVKIKRTLHLPLTFSEVQKGDWVTYHGQKRGNITPGLLYQVLGKGEFGFFIGRHLTIRDLWNKEYTTEAYDFNLVGETQPK
jgi:hypothetical protein